MADKEYESIKLGDYWSGGDTYNRNPYQASDTVNEAKMALDLTLWQKPGAYTSQWQTQLSDTIGKIANRDKFSYDVNGDALYQQYKDKYIQQGKMAMQDTMGQAAAMTGGYGNSYAATVGNQAYQAQLNNLNDVIPELYQMAYDRYNQDTQDLYNQYSMYADRDNTDYGRHRDEVSDWQTDRNYLANRYDSERNFDYGVYSDKESAKQTQFNADREAAYSQYINDYNNAYNAYRDSVADEQWQKEYDLASTPKVVDNDYDDDDYEPEPEYTYKETPEVKSFTARIRTPSEFARGSNSDNKKYKTYNDYVKGMLDKYESELTDNDIATIAQKYGLK